MTTNTDITAVRDTTNTTGFRPTQHHAAPSAAPVDTLHPQIGTTGKHYTYEDAVSGDDRTAGWTVDTPDVTGADFDSVQGDYDDAGADSLVTDNVTGHTGSIDGRGPAVTVTDTTRTSRLH